MEMEMEVGAWDTALAGRARPGGVRIAADRLGAVSRGTLGNDHSSAMMGHIPQLPGCDRRHARRRPESCYLLVPRLALDAAAGGRWAMTIVVQ